MDKNSYSTGSWPCKTRWGCIQETQSGLFRLVNHLHNRTMEDGSLKLISITTSSSSTYKSTKTYNHDHVDCNQAENNGTQRSAKETRFWNCITLWFLEEKFHWWLDLEGSYLFMTGIASPSWTMGLFSIQDETKSRWMQPFWQTSWYV